MTRSILVALCVAIPQTTFAATIIWEAFGVVSQSSQFGAVAPPPRATPWSLELQFDPDLSVHTPNWPADAPCSMTSLAGAFTLGGATYVFSGGPNVAFTNSMLPVDNCRTNPTGTVEFFMFPTAADDPWHLRTGGYFLLASYEDLYQDGAFPSEPAYSYPGFLIFRNDSFQFAADFSPRAVQQPAPIPEPATTTLVGIGLAFLGRRQWRRRSA